MSSFFLSGARLIMGAYDSLPEINAATLSGAIDIVVVQQEDGSLLSSPFHVRFGRFKVLRKPRDRIVKITVNAQLCDFVMRLGSAGEAYFVEETDEPPAAEEEMTSPILSPREEGAAPSQTSMSETNSRATSPSPNPSPRAHEEASGVAHAASSPNLLPLPSPAGASDKKIAKAWSWSWGRLPKQLDDGGDMFLSEALERQLIEAEKQQQREENAELEAAEGDGMEEGHSTGVVDDAQPRRESGQELVVGTSTSMSLSDVQAGGGVVEVDEEGMPRLSIVNVPSICHEADTSSIQSARTDAEMTSPLKLSPRVPGLTLTESGNLLVPFDAVQSPQGHAITPPSDHSVGVLVPLNEQGEQVGGVMHVDMGLGSLAAHEESEAGFMTPDARLHSVQKRDRDLDFSDDDAQEDEESEPATRRFLAQLLQGVLHQSSKSKQETLAKTSSKRSSSAPNSPVLNKHARTGHADTSSNDIKRNRDDTGDEKLSEDSVPWEPRTSEHNESPALSSTKPQSLLVPLKDPNAVEGVSDRCRRMSESAEDSTDTLMRNAGETEYRFLRNLSITSTTEKWMAETQECVLLSMCGKELRPGQTLSEQRECFLRHLLTLEKFLAYPVDLSTSPDLCVCVRGSIYRWQVLAPALMCALAFQRDLPLDTHHQLLEAFQSNDRLFQGNRTRSNEEVDEVGQEDSLRPDYLLDLDDVDIGDEGGDVERELNTEGRKRSKKYSRKTLIPSSEQLASLPLREGNNTIKFYQGTHETLQLYPWTCVHCCDMAATSLNAAVSHKASVEPVSASIFLWKSHDKVVISDVDGTITKSDVLGHMLPRVGIQWAQKGVPQLMTSIKANDYRILYLTARPIGQVDATKSYLQRVEEDGVHLPVGPVITSPDGLFKSLNREVIQRRPEEFKIECLRNLQKLFSSRPFYAGFGNRPTDVVSYRAVEVPDSRILIINPQGEIHNALNQAFVTSYDGLRELVDLMFPFVSGKSEDHEDTDGFTDHNFWKLPNLAAEPGLN